MSDYDKMKQREAELAKKYPGSMSGLPEKTERMVGPASYWKYDLEGPEEVARREAALRAMQPMEDMNLPLTAPKPMEDMGLPLTANSPGAKKQPDAQKMRAAALEKMMASNLMASARKR